MQVVLATNFSRLHPRPVYIIYASNRSTSELGSRALLHLRSAGYRELKRFGWCGSSNFSLLMELSFPSSSPSVRGDQARWSSIQESVAKHAWPHQWHDRSWGESVDLSRSVHRLIDTARILVDLTRGSGVERLWRILDVGGKDFAKLAHLAGWCYTSIDLNRPQQHGTGGYQEGTDLTYDGKTLPFEEDSFEIVILSFVLHHAADNTLALLRQVRSISNSFVIIGEDLSSLDHPLVWHQRNQNHQPGGIFRSDAEWRALFSHYDLMLWSAYNVRSRADLICDALSEDDFSAHVYRVLYVLRSSSGSHASFDSARAASHQPLQIASTFTPAAASEHVATSSSAQHHTGEETCHVRKAHSLRLALCFFGVTRGIARTLPGLLTNLISPLSSVGVVDIFVHTLLGPVENSHFPRERLAQTRPLDFLLLKPCRFAVEEQRIVDVQQRLHVKVNATFHRSQLLFREYYDRQTILNVFRSRYSLSQARIASSLPPPISPPPPHSLNTPLAPACFTPPPNCSVLPNQWCICHAV